MNPASQHCPLPVGTRLRLTKMENDPLPVPIGTTGTVTGGTALQIWMRWDNGRTLMLLPDEDEWEVISLP